MCVDPGLLASSDPVLPVHPAALRLGRELVEVGRQLEHGSVVAPALWVSGVAAAVVLPRLAVGRVDALPPPLPVQRVAEPLLQLLRLLARRRLVQRGAQVGHRAVKILVVLVRRGARLERLAHARRRDGHAWSRATLR